MGKSFGSENTLSAGLEKSLYITMATELIVFPGDLILEMVLNEVYAIDHHMVITIRSSHT